MENFSTMKLQKFSYFGDIMRGEKYETLKFKFRGRIEWWIGCGRPRVTWTQYIRQWICLTTVELFRIAQNREDWNIMAVHYMTLRRRKWQQNNLNAITPIFHFQICRPCYFFEDSLTRNVNLYLIFWLGECAK